jgi:hypothetical protein
MDGMILVVLNKILHIHLCYTFILILKTEFMTIFQKECMTIFNHTYAYYKDNIKVIEIKLS